MNPVVGVVLLPPPSLRLDDSVVVLRYVSSKHGDTFQSVKYVRKSAGPKSRTRTVEAFAREFGAWRPRGAVTAGGGE